MNFAKEVDYKQYNISSWHNFVDCIKKTTIKFNINFIWDANALGEG